MCRKFQNVRKYCDLFAEIMIEGGRNEKEFIDNGNETIEPNGDVHNVGDSQEEIVEEHEHEIVEGQLFVIEFTRNE